MANADSTSGRYDCIVIGGGHNGLVCAAYLAKSRRRVLVLEAASQVGGAAVTREFAPGYRVSSAAHLLHLMPRALMQELALDAHGLRLAHEAMPTSALSPSGAPLSLGVDSSAALPGASRADALAYAPYVTRLQRLAQALRPVMTNVPPRLGTDLWSDRLALLRLAWKVRCLGRRDMRELLRIIGMNVYDLLEEHFDTPLLKGALGFDAVLGTNFGPRSPGTVLTLLYRLAAHDKSSRLAQPVGGLGALSDALAKAATAAGATIRTGAAVGRIDVQEDRVQGVTLQSGEAIAGGGRHLKLRSQDDVSRPPRQRAPGYRIRPPRDSPAHARACGKTASRFGCAAGSYRFACRLRLRVDSLLPHRSNTSSAPTTTRSTPSSQANRSSKSRCRA